MRKHRLLVNALSISLIFTQLPINALASNNIDVDDQDCYAEEAVTEDIIEEYEEAGSDFFDAVIPEYDNDTDDGAEDQKQDDPVVLDVDEEDEEPDEVLEQDKDDPNRSEGLWVTSIDDTRIFYTGQKITPAVRVYDGNKLLKDKTDYTLTYQYNKNVYETKDTKETNEIYLKLESPAVRVVLKGNYSGELVSSFQIHPAQESLRSLKKALIGNINSSYVYDGEPITPKPTVTLNGTELKENEDYAVSYVNNNRAGKATVVITGIGLYKGSRRIAFKIKGRKINANSIVINDGNPVESAYCAGGAKPVLKVEYVDGDTKTLLKENVDYTVKWSNNKAVTTDKSKKRSKALITGKGFYIGKHSVVFKVNLKEFSADSGLSVIAQDITESDKPGSYATTVSITDSDGVLLKPGKDYDKNIKYFACNKETLEKGDELDSTSHPVAGDLIYVEITGKGCYSSDVISCLCRVIPQNMNIAGADVTIRSQTYKGNNKPVTIPEDDSQFTVKMGERRIGLVAEGYPDGFEIVKGSYRNNTKCGNASVIIHGTGIYGGYKTVTFKIEPKTGGNNGNMHLKPIEPEYVEGELFCLADSEEEAQAIADSYRLFGITVKSFSYGVAVFDCGDNDLHKIIAFGEAHGLTPLAYNHIYHLFENSEDIVTDAAKERDKNRQILEE